MTSKTIGGQQKHIEIRIVISYKESLKTLILKRVRNLTKKFYNFRHKHFSGFIQQNLDYIFILNSLQEYSKGSGILTTLSTQYSPVFFSAFN